MSLLGLIAFIALVLSLLFIYLAQRERMNSGRGPRRKFKPRWRRSAGEGSSRRRRRLSFRR